MNTQTQPAVECRLDGMVRPAKALRLTAKQKKRLASIVWMKQYLAGYPQEKHALDYSEETFIDDMLYGIGVALHGSKVSYAQGFDKWRQMLRDHLTPKA